MALLLGATCIAACNPDTTRPTISPEPTGPFADVTQKSGVSFVHDNGGSGRFYMPEIMGAGAALFDADGDGDLNLYLVQGGPIKEGGLPSSDRFLRNDVNTGTDGTEMAGIP